MKEEKPFVSNEKIAQVAQQCRAVEHLANVLAEIHRDYAAMLNSGSGDKILDIVGERTAHFMEVLGDMLNGMDAVDDGDEWLAPIYAEAQRLYPAQAGEPERQPAPESAG